MPLDVSIKDLIPTRFIAAWETVLPDEGEACLSVQPGYRLKDVHSTLDFDEKELSGALWPTWISVETGTPFSAPCKPNHIFSWHYHPDGDSRFSVEDWISFVVSGARITLLLTANCANLYTKLSTGKWKEIASAVSASKDKSKNKPNLQFVRFMKLMHKELKVHDWTSCAEDLIAFALGIDYKMESIK